MSLINDALNRARAEAGQREALDRGEAIPPLHYSPRHRIQLPGFLFIGVAVLAALIAFNLWMTRAPESQGAPVSPPASQARTQGASPGAQIPDAGESLLTEAPSTAHASLSTADSTPEASPSSTSSTLTAAAAKVTTTTRESPPPPATPGVVEPARRQSAPLAAPAPEPEDATPAPEFPLMSDAAPESAPVDSESRHALPGGDELRLQGIAWSASSPTAFVNGRLLGVGDRVLGFEILEIGRRTVRLSSPRGEEISLRFGGSGDD